MTQHRSSVGRERRTWIAAAYLVSGLLLDVKLVHGQGTPGFDVRVDAPAEAGCISSQELIASIEERTGGDARGVPGAPRVSIAVVLAKQATGHSARISSTDPSGRMLGSRELQVPGPCRELDEMLVLVIASGLGIAPNAEPEPHSERYQVELPRTPALNAPSATIPASIEPPEPWTLDLEAVGRLFTGTLPTVTGAVGLGARLGRGGFSVRASAIVMLPTAPHLMSRVPVELTGVFGQIEGCARAAHGARVALLLCAGAQSGAMRAEAQLWHSTARWDGILQLVPSVWLAGRAFGQIGVGLGMGATIPVLFPGYSYRDAAGNAARLYAIEVGAFAELALWFRFGP